MDTHVFNWNDSLEKMKAMVTEHVQGVIDNLNKQFFDLPIFNVSKLFSLKYYPIDNWWCND